MIDPELQLLVFEKLGEIGRLDAAAAKPFGGLALGTAVIGAVFGDHPGRRCGDFGAQVRLGRVFQRGEVQVFQQFLVRE